MAGAVNKIRQDVAGAAGTAVGHAESLMHDAKEGIKSAADTVSQQAKSVMGNVAGKASEVAGAAEHRTNETLHAVGNYLQGQDVRGMADDLTKIVKQYPVPAVLVTFGIGFMIAAAFRR